jgi:hypothetical protein
MKRFTRIMLLAAISFFPAVLSAQSGGLGSSFTQGTGGTYTYTQTIEARGVSAAALERKMNAWVARALEPAEGGNLTDGMLCFLVLKESPDANDFVSFNTTMTFENGSVTINATDFMYQSISTENGTIDAPLNLLGESTKSRVYPLLDRRWSALMSEMQRAARR